MDGIPDTTTDAIGAASDTRDATCLDAASSGICIVDGAIPAGAGIGMRGAEVGSAVCGAPTTAGPAGAGVDGIGVDTIGEDAGSNGATSIGWVSGSRRRCALAPAGAGNDVAAVTSPGGESTGCDPDCDPDCDATNDESETRGATTSGSALPSTSRCTVDGPPSGVGARVGEVGSAVCPGCVPGATAATSPDGTSPG